MRNKIVDIWQASCGERFFVTSRVTDKIREVIHLCLEEAIILGITEGKVKEQLLLENELTLENMLVIFPALEISHLQI